MPTASEETPTAREMEIWNEVEPRLRDRFGKDADIRATVNGDHIDVRILPTEFDDDLGKDWNVVPYNAFRMTIRPDD